MFAAWKEPIAESLFVERRTAHPGTSSRPLVMLLSLNHPLRAFEEICMLDHLSGGRVEMGMGRGCLPLELSYFGIDADTVPARYLEASEILMEAMRGVPFPIGVTIFS
ncbi:hypothetical protein QFZ97_007183 [Paraburkholderia youngii]|nr:LLM class flavin-dependent oxidoreductase [Paraburkholderia youngii]